MPIRVLVVDDTALYRKILGDAIKAIPDATLVGSAANGELALSRLAQGGIDLVLLDVVMPGLCGPEVMEKMRPLYPDVAVVLISGATGIDADSTVQALSKGAFDFIAKPQSGMNPTDAAAALVQELTRVLKIYTARRASRTAAKVPVAAGAPAHNAPILFNTTPASPPPAAPPPAAAPASAVPAPRRLAAPPTKIELLVIAVSTGGPKALGVLVPKLTAAALRCPTLIVQHMPALFTASLAEQLARASSLPVREAADAEVLAPGTLLIAPGGRHLTIVRDSLTQKLRTKLTDDQPVHSCRPAADVLFRSVAATVTGPVLAVVLTGMGEDGAAGVAALKTRTTWCIAQDQATCVVYGMPQAVATRGLADEVLPLEQIAPRINALLSR